MVASYPESKSIKVDSTRLDVYTKLQSRASLVSYWHIVSKSLLSFPHVGLFALGWNKPQRVVIWANGQIKWPAGIQH